MKLISKLWKMRGGVHPEFRKETSTQHPIKTLALPPQLIIPVPEASTDMRIIVSVGDKVLKGQPLTTLNSGALGAIAHAPSSGIVSNIAKHPLPHPSGLSGICIVIDTDGSDTWIDAGEVKAESAQPSSTTPFTNNDILSRIESAGLVGLGGAAFPSAVKLAAAGKQVIDTLIINAAECEPYITCDDRLIRERANEIIAGVGILMQLVQPKQCIVGIEDNKSEAIAALNTALQNSKAPAITVAVVPTQYPSGDARQLTQLLTGIEVPKNTHALASGVLCHNVATAYAVYDAVTRHKPLLSRIVTITGDGVMQAQNVEALIGTPISFIIKQLGGYNNNAERLLMGGPMMGFALPSDELPIIKASNCILVTSKAQLQLTSKAEITSQETMPCIRCNKCAQVCPVNLLPQQLYWHAKAHDFERVMTHNLSDCIECGACSYVCPSHIPLVDYFRFAKTEINAQQHAVLKSDKSRERFEFNEFRKQRIKQEREEKRRLHKAALIKKKAEEAEVLKKQGGATASAASQQGSDKLAKQDAIKAAMARAKAKKAAMKAAQQEANQ